MLIIWRNKAKREEKGCLPDLLEGRRQWQSQLVSVLLLYFSFLLFSVYLLFLLCFCPPVSFFFPLLLPLHFVFVSTVIFSWNAPFLVQLLLKMELWSCGVKELLGLVQLRGEGEDDDDGDGGLPDCCCFLLCFSVSFFCLFVFSVS
ncbi:hypothetical protein Peur_070685 [Populus x canadensis]